MPRASHWVTSRAAATVTGRVSQAGIPARSPIVAKSAATTQLTADEEPELDLDRADALEGLVGVHAVLQRVADAVDGAHAGGTDLGAQRLHVAVEGAGAGGVGPAPHLAHELLAGAHGPGCRRERGEEVELERGEVHLGAVDGDPAGGAVDLERADAAGRGRRRGELGGALDPAEQGVGARDDLAHPERLGDVVVGADAEPHEDVGLVVAGGEHEHRDRADGLDAAAHLEPVEAGQHDVEDDEVGVRAR